jgi:UDP-2,3-diacylglucosamine pyrophosphatase LpxH
VHDEFLEALLAIANVRLLAAYTDEGLGFDGNSMQVFIPDLHLVSDARRADFDYGTNYDKTLLVSVAGVLRNLKGAATAAGQRFNVFHIGDYLDLWREVPPAALDATVPDKIKDDHRPLTDILEDDALNTGFLLGNHDFDLYRFVGYNTWARRFFLPGDDPSIVVMHGDYFDWVERDVPEALRDIAVFYFGPTHQAGDALVGQMWNLSTQCMHADYSQFIQLAQPAIFGSLLPEGGDVPANYNLQQRGAPGATNAGLMFLDKACAACVQANAASDTKLRMVIIGHTHHARIAVQPMADGTRFALVDIGAWIENCSEQEGGPATPNAQITALSANQIRIYQLAPR